jgi:hypothetical protein
VLALTKDYTTLTKGYTTLTKYAETPTKDPMYVVRKPYIRYGWYTAGMQLLYSTYLWEDGYRKKINPRAHPTEVGHLLPLCGFLVRVVVEIFVRKIASHGLELTPINGASGS